jgi:hypothetical protein
MTRRHHAGVASRAGRTGVSTIDSPDLIKSQLHSEVKFASGKGHSWHKQKSPTPTCAPTSAGHSQADAARHFGVSEAAIHQRLKRLRQLTSRVVALEKAGDVVAEKLTASARLERVQRVIDEELAWAVRKFAGPSAVLVVHARRQRQRSPAKQRPRNNHVSVSFPFQRKQFTDTLYHRQVACGRSRREVGHPLRAIAPFERRKPTWDFSQKSIQKPLTPPGASLHLSWFISN